MSETVSSKILRHPEEYDDVIPNVTLAQYVLDKMREFGGDIACVIKINCIIDCLFSLEFLNLSISFSVKIDPDTKRSLSYHEICENTLALAAGLQLKLNLKPGDMVAVALPTCLDYSITVLALNLCGATSTLINPGQTICKINNFSFDQATL